MEHLSGGLHIPYHLPDGTLAPRYRISTTLVAREGSRWSKGKGTIVPYGWAAEERESGTWCWWKGVGLLDALVPGLPGAGTPRRGDGRRPWRSLGSRRDRPALHRAPTGCGGGRQWGRALAHRLKGWQWQGKAFVLHLPGAKDPERSLSTGSARDSRRLSTGAGAG